MKKKLFNYGYVSQKDFMTELFPVPKEWNEYKKGERWYSGIVSDLFFKTKKEAREFYKNYGN